MAPQGSSFQLVLSTATEIPSRLSGYLRATCAKSDEGSCVLTKKEHRTPIHISKPYWDGSSLLLNVMSPTAGLLEWDRVELDVEVRPGASLVLSNPCATRIHKMDTGTAFWEQTFKIEKGAFIETNPEWLIPQGESRFEQRTKIDISTEGEALFIETLAPGRVAYGEVFEFTRFRNRLELRYDGRLAALESYELSRRNNSLAPWQSSGKTPFYISMYLVSSKLERNDSIFKAIHNLASDNTAIGSSRLAAGPCWNVKIISDNPVSSKHTANEVRSLYYSAIARAATDLRR